MADEVAAVPPPPPGFVPAPKTLSPGSALDSIQAQEQMLAKRYGEAGEAMQRTAEGREKTLAPMEEALKKQIEEPYPTREKVALPEWKPEPVIDAKDYEALSYGLLGMALIGGAVSKGNWLAVGEELNGALKGYLEGNKLVAEKRFQDYNNQFKSAVAREQQANREFEDILTNKKLRLHDQMELYKIAAAKYDRQDALQAAKMKSYDAMWKSLESNKLALMRLEQGQQKINIQINKGLGGGVGMGGGQLSPAYESDPAYKSRVDYWAKFIANGGQVPARWAQMVGKQMSNDVFNRVPQIGQGDPNDMLANKTLIAETNAEARRLGTQAASVGIANKELESFIPAAEKAVDGVSRTGWKPINQLIEAGSKTWSPEQGRLMVAHRAVLNAYSQLIQRGAPTVHSMDEAEKILSTADSPEVYKAKMDQLRIEGVQAEKGIVNARDSLIEQVKKIGKGGSSAPAQEKPETLTTKSGGPSVGEKRTINGVPAEWDGKGWKKVSSADELTFTPVA